MRRFTLLSIVAALCFAARIEALPPDVLWTQTFGGNNFEICSSVWQTEDGGYILGGSTESFGSGQTDMYLVKTDATGAMEWAQTYGGNDDEHGKSVQQTDDGGYILAGYTLSFGVGGYDLYLIKTDAQGVMEWSQTFGGNNFDVCYSAQQTDDGGYILAGYTLSFGAGQYDMYLVKTDSQGNFDWQQTFGGGNNEECNCVQQTSDGGYILVGYQQTQPLGFDVYIVKTDDAGNLDWQQTYDEGGYEGGFSIIQTPDGGYAMNGYTTSFGEGLEDMYLMKVDAFGVMEWQKSFGGPSYDSGSSLSLTVDDGYILGGTTYSLGDGSGDMYIIKTNSNGDVEWFLNQGGQDFDNCMDIRQTSDGGFIAAGKSNSFGMGTGDMYLVKLDGFPFVSVKLTPENPPIIIPPGGDSFNFNIEVENHETIAETFDVWTDVMLPDESLFGPIIGPVNLSLPGGQVVNRDRSQAVPGAAPFGDYSYHAYVGEYPDYIWSSDSFPFSKPATVAGGMSVNDWETTGDSFEELFGGDVVISPSRFALLGAYPNPFNPATTISFELPTADFVDLAIYDISGRLVSELIDGWWDAGEHEVTFDGSNLVSGVYIYRLNAGQFSASGEMVLMK